MCSECLNFAIAIQTHFFSSVPYTVAPTLHRPLIGLIFIVGGWKTGDLIQMEERMSGSEISVVCSRCGLTENDRTDRSLAADVHPERSRINASSASVKISKHYREVIEKGGNPPLSPSI